MCAGVVPQQPPTSQTPLSTILAISSANSSGDTSKTVVPFSVLGKPAFGFIITGIEQQASICSARENI